MSDDSGEWDFADEDNEPDDTDSPSIRTITYDDLIASFPFPNIRPIQDHILKLVAQGIRDGKRFIIVEAATGTGKSGLAMAAAIASSLAYLSTQNKFLQDQYLRDFSDDIYDMRGRGNYICSRYPGKNASNAPCRTDKELTKDCKEKGCCDYYRAVGEAAAADITSFNLSAYIAFTNYHPHFKTKRNKTRHINIIDEAHNLIDGVTNFGSIVINLESLQDLALVSELPDYDTLDEYIDFINEVGVKAAALLDSPIMEELSNKQIDELENIVRKVRVVKKYRTVEFQGKAVSNYVLDKEYSKDVRRQLKKVEFKPVIVGPLLDNLIFKKAEVNILLSATILDHSTFMDLCGIDKDEAISIVADSPFPVANRPIFTRFTVGRINRNSLPALLPEIVRTVDKILDFYKDRKGMIHTHTYDIANYIYNHTSSKRILYPRTASEQKDMLEKHAGSERPTVMMSPSMKEGVDLKDDLCRFQIMVRLPWPYLGDPLVKARGEAYPKYINMKTALSILQEYGRAVRSETDYAYTFPLDEMFITFVQRNRDILPASFLAAIQN